MTEPEGTVKAVNGLITAVIDNLKTVEQILEMEAEVNGELGLGAIAFSVSEIIEQLGYKVELLNKELKK